MPVTDDVYTIFQKMIEQTDEIKGLKYDMRQLERINGKMLDQKVRIKYDRTNFNIYVKQLKGGTVGLEVLYRKGWNNKKALINPNGFPWINVNLSPYGSQMRKNQHHTVLDVGYELFAPLMESMLKRYGKEINSMSEKKGARTFDGRQVWEIEINNPYFRWVDYTVKQGENVTTIASQKKVSEYMIVMKNNSVDSYTDVKAGQTIKIPSDYAAQITFYIDQKTMLPLMLKIHDEKGLFEQYEYLNLKLDAQFSSDEFSEDFKEYNF